MIRDRAVTRRALVAGIIGAPLVLAACGSGGGGPSTSGAPMSRCAQGEAGLIALYDAAITQHPDKAFLVTIRAQHQEHLDAFVAAGASATQGAPTSNVSVKDLQKAEQSAADARTQDCIDAGTDAEVARLIALVAASEAAHAALLGDES